MRAFQSQALSELAVSIDYGLTASARNGDGPRFLRITDLQNDSVDWSAVPSCDCSKEDAKKFALSGGDIVFARTGATTGKSYLITSPPHVSVFASYLIRVRAKESVFPPFLAHFFKSQKYWRQISSLSEGAAQPGVNATKLGSLQIPVPPLDEQKRIAAILDKADSLRRKRQQAIRLADDFLRAVFLDMFGDPVTNPKGWPIEKLRSVTTKITDGTHKSPPMAAAGIPYVTAKHIKQEGVRFDLAPTYISESDHREIYSRCDPTLGDVLYIKDGATTGIACKNNLPGEFSLLSSVALIRPNRDRLRSEYLVELLNNEKFKTALTGDMAGAAIKRFTLSKIGDFKLPIPLIEKQNEFGTIAEKVKTLQIKLRDELKANQALFSAIQSQFF